MMATLPTYLIYVVEDDDEDCLLLKQALQQQGAGCLIHFFSNGADLFTRLTHQMDGRLPDLIFLDIDTPIMNGFDTLRLLKQSQPYRRIPVIIRTEHETLEHINRCYELGCEAYLTKSDFDLPLSRLIGDRNSSPC